MYLLFFICLYYYLIESVSFIAQHVVLELSLSRHIVLNAMVVCGKCDKVIKTPS